MTASLQLHQAGRGSCIPRSKGLGRPCSSGHFIARIVQPGGKRKSSLIDQQTQAHSVRPRSSRRLQHAILGASLHNPNCRNVCVSCAVDTGASQTVEKYSLQSEPGLVNGSSQQEQRRKPRIFISTGDVSGDLHAAALVRELHRQANAAGREVTVCALGGGTIEEAGGALIGDNRGLSSIGLLEALPLVIPTLRLQSKLRSFLQEHPPEAVVLIDYPGVNITFGRYLREKFGCPVYYYIPPNEWLWNQARTPAICGLSDTILCTYPREAAYFREAGGNVQLVGHPLLDAVDSKPDRDTARSQLGLPAGTRMVALLPASRPQEIRHVWPVIARAAQLVQQQWTRSQGCPIRFFVPAVSQQLGQQIEDSLQEYGLEATLWQGDPHVVLAAADLALTKSGTVNLELALFKVPQVVVYSIDAVTAWLARAVFKFNVPRISLVNLILEEGLVPEFIQEAAQAEGVAAAALRLLHDEDGSRDQVLDGYQRLKSHLGHPGAAKRAAGVAKHQRAAEVERATMWTPAMYVRKGRAQAAAAACILSEKRIAAYDSNVCSSN